MTKITIIGTGMYHLGSPVDKVCMHIVRNAFLKSLELGRISMELRQDDGLGSLRIRMEI